MNKKVTLIIASVLVVILAVVLIFIGLQSCDSNKGKTDDITVNASGENGVTVDLETGSIISKPENDTSSEDKSDDKNDDKFVAEEPGASNSNVASGDSSSTASNDSSTSTGSGPKDTTNTNSSAMEGQGPWY